MTRDGRRVLSETRKILIWFDVDGRFVTGHGCGGMVTFFTDAGFFLHPCGSIELG